MIACLQDFSRKRRSGLEEVDRRRILVHEIQTDPARPALEGEAWGRACVGIVYSQELNDSNAGDEDTSMS